MNDRLGSRSKRKRRATLHSSEVGYLCSTYSQDKECRKFVSHHVSMARKQAGWHASRQAGSEVKNVKDCLKENMNMSDNAIPLVIGGISADMRDI